VRSDVPRLLAAADVFVLSSSWEGNPLAVMEAMAARRPVVATRVGCVPELVPEAAGEIVEAGDHWALARAMSRLGRDLALARAKGAAAGEIARDRFDDVAMAKAYERLYLEVAGCVPSITAASRAARTSPVTVGDTRERTRTRVR
jgi:glycosyltransferase involved in cell wall biosynthesis